MAAVRSQGAAQLRPGLRRAVPAAHRTPPAQRLPEARRHAWRSWPKQIGIAPATLEATVAEFNAPRESGRGPGIRQGQQSLQPLPRRCAWSRPTPASLRWSTAPYYAIKLVIGDIGTFAGLVTDENTQVLDAAGKPIKGLYAVGNDAASVMGGNYPGAGITLGPALTFGYVAAMQLAKAAATVQVNLQVERREPVALAAARVKPSAQPSKEPS